MAKKKNQKRQHSRTVELKRQLEQEKLADEKDRSKNRMDPAARALLLGDLVFLAVVSILAPPSYGFGLGLISDEISAVCTIIGAILLVIALWLQFGNKNRRNGPGQGPRL